MPFNFIIGCCKVNTYADCSLPIIVQERITALNVYLLAANSSYVIPNVKVSTSCIASNISSSNKILFL